MAYSSLTMLTPNLLILVILVWDVCQHAADGRYVDSDEFTTLVAEVSAMKEERLEFNNRIIELETKLSIGEAKLSAVEDKLRVTEVKLVGTEKKLRIVECKLHGAQSRIDQLEKKSEILRYQQEMTSNHATDEEIGHETEGEIKITATKHMRRKGISREWPAAGHGQTISKRIITTTAQQIAFSVFLDTTLTGLGNEHPIKFDGFHLNAGNAYDAMMGVFICPISGVYMFQSAVQTTYHGFIETEIVKDGTALVRMYAAGSMTGHGYDQGFNSVITTCNQGEHVWVRVFGARGTTVNYGRFSTFSGYLLWTI